ncbi:hypothetical protein L6V77_11745 [Myxococcota bacterium]|nr:hypothetical protein [Myxococcota bacterium]
MTGETRPNCVQRCGQHPIVCTEGRWPACDPNGGEQPQLRCYDNDGDGHFSSHGPECHEYCNPGTNGSVAPWDGNPRWLLAAGRANDDCDENNPNRFVGNPDGSCDGVDQDCTEDEPRQQCRHCGDAACGQCPECPAGFGNHEGRCRQDGAWEEGFWFGDWHDGNADAWYGGGAYDGVYEVPGVFRRDVGHFSFRIWRHDINPGGCCWQGPDGVALVQCYAGDRVSVIWERVMNGADFWNSAPDLGGSQYIEFSHPDLAGGFCHFLLMDNHNTCCCGCSRRFAHMNTHATSDFCR